MGEVGKGTQRRNTNRTTTTDPTGEIAVKKSGCISLRCALWRGVPMVGLGLFDQKGTLAVAMPIVTAFKFCVGHIKNGLLNGHDNRQKLSFGFFFD